MGSDSSKKRTHPVVPNQQESKVDIEHPNEEEENKINTEISSQELVQWGENIIGQTRAKQTLEQLFFFPRRFPSFCQNLNSQSKQEKIRRCILFWGPPGTGKTLLAKSLAKAHEAELVDCSPANILNKWVGESEKIIQNVFAKAKRQKTIVFIDEVDSYGRQRQSDEREHVRTRKTQLLQSIDNFEDDLKSDSACIACTNFYNELDSALLRRFTDHVFCPLPNRKDRYLLLQYFMKDTMSDLTNEHLDTIACLAELFSGSDLERLVRQASQISFREIFKATHFVQNQNGSFSPCAPNTLHAEPKDLKSLDYDALAPKRNVRFTDFTQALKEVRPSITRLRYEKYLKLANLDPHEQNVEGKKTPLEVELGNVFEPKSNEEAVLGEFSVYLQLQRYMSAAGNPESKIYATAQSWLISVLVLFTVLLLTFPTLLWILLLCVALLELLSAVIMPLGYVIYDSVWNSKDTALAIANQSLHEVCGFSLLLLIKATGCQYIKYANNFSFTNIIVEWYFIMTIMRMGAHYFNFYFLRVKSGYSFVMGIEHAIKQITKIAQKRRKITPTRVTTSKPSRKPSQQMPYKQSEDGGNDGNDGDGDDDDALFDEKYQDINSSHNRPTKNGTTYKHAASKSTKSRKRKHHKKQTFDDPLRQSLLEKDDVKDKRRK